MCRHALRHGRRPVDDVGSQRVDWRTSTVQPPPWRTQHGRGSRRAVRCSAPEASQRDDRLQDRRPLGCRALLAAESPPTAKTPSDSRHVGRAAEPAFVRLSTILRVCACQGAGPRGVRRSRPALIGSAAGLKVGSACRGSILLPRRSRTTSRRAVRRGGTVPGWRSRYGWCGVPRAGTTTCRPPVKRSRPLRRHARARDRQVCGTERDQTAREVDEEHRPPGDRLGQHAADERSKGEKHHRGGCRKTRACASRPALRGRPCRAASGSGLAWEGGP